MVQGIGGQQKGALLSGEVAAILQENVDLVQRPDNFFMPRWVTIN